LSDSSKKLYLTILNSALAYLGEDTKALARISKGYRANKPVEPCPTAEEVERIYNSLKSARDKTILGLMAYQGLRVSEVQGLTLESLVGENMLLLEHTKGKQDAIVNLVHHRLIGDMQRYLGTRPDVKDKHLFLTRYGKGMTLPGMKYAITKWCTDLGLEYHAHSFRRYFANTLSKAGVPLQTICAAMRHKSVKTTMTYLNIGSTDVADALATVYGTSN
jgi:integrase/recombinase XerD